MLFKTRQPLKFRHGRGPFPDGSFLIPSHLPTSFMRVSLRSLALTALGNSPNAPHFISRRGLANRAFLSGFVVDALAPRHPADAFDNGIPDMELYRNKTKYPGVQPENLGLQPNGRLTPCIGAQNCFSTSGDESHLLRLWRCALPSN